MTETTKARLRTTTTSILVTAVGITVCTAKGTKTPAKNMWLWRSFAWDFSQLFGSSTRAEPSTLGDVDHSFSPFPETHR